MQPPHDFHNPESTLLSLNHATALTIVVIFGHGTGYNFI